MNDIFYLAWRYISFNRFKTLTLVTCIALILFLPLALKMLLMKSEQQLMSRAVSTPLLLGARGNSLDLVMNSLYFADERPDSIKMQSVEDIYHSGMALPIPLYARFKSGDHPIVGTSLDYFDFRQLELSSGRLFAMLGECVIGAEVAERLGLSTGDKILSSPENLFDLAGVYPLKMTITGILKKSYSVDDKSVFVDLKTAWVIQGLGHGHQDVNTITDNETLLNRNKNSVTTSAKIKQYTEIDGNNLDSFHFHGNPSIYPLTAIIAVPTENKSATILRGRYLSSEQTEQLVRPQDVISDLLNTIFKMKSFIDAVVFIVALAMLLAICLVFSLSYRLRKNEINTIFHLGCSQGTVIQLIAAEISIILLFSAGLCALGLLALQHVQSGIVLRLFVS